ncbi:hypothetical protein BDN70DRAFT_795554 [Pholiota conissans]|uniref:Calcium uniporter protein, mitochondrial n=1 Tax=Pholiota conissans TaxID=109636 RepID=A0A9P5ZDZ2_9AGAR|nr:hypothetical protein BDN70DRAFT_795554 [Pholiota conissans]
MSCFRPIFARIPFSVYRVSRRYTSHKTELDVSHSHFLADASPKAKWKEWDSSKSRKTASSRDELEGVTDNRGKLSPTSSHLFKLILPLGALSHPSNDDKSPEDLKNGKHSSKTPPTIFLLHPSQPLSHVSSLILASLSPATPSISFRSIPSNNLAFQWSDATDLGDFIRDAARSSEFVICISYGPASARKRLLPAANQEKARIVPVNTAIASGEKEGSDGKITETLITVSIPTFADRTRFLRRRLNLIEGRLQDMEGLKVKCDIEAHRGAKQMAVGGLGMLVVYWAAVARLTFWDYGWDIMEPITYLSGLSTVILGYLWFLYQGREVSYTTVLARSISARREALYKSRGLDIERWQELMSERKALRAEIGRIARDYEGDEDDDISLDDEKYMDSDGENSGNDEAHGGREDVTGATDDVDSQGGIERESGNRATTDEAEDAQELNGKKEARKADLAGL